MPYSGPVSAWGTIGHAQAAYIHAVNESGGVNGRRILLISLDDGYSPPKTVEQIRRLVEQDQVLAIFGSVGTPTNAAVQKYLNQKQVPQAFIQTGASRWNDPKHFPWTVPGLPLYTTEAAIYARYALRNRPDAKIAVLYQNDDLGKDYLAGVKAGLGDKAASVLVAQASYEVTDPTVESQIVALKQSGANVLVDAASAKFTAQAIRKTWDVGWRPMHFISVTSTSPATVLLPAGWEKSVGLLNAAYQKAVGDRQWHDDQDYLQYREFMRTEFATGNPEDQYAFSGWASVQLLVHLLWLCGDELTRENLLRQATHLKDVRTPALLPGISYNTSPDDYRAIRKMRMQRFNGEQWELFGEMIEE